MSDVVDSTADEVGTDITPHQPSAGLALAPTVTAGDLVARLDVIRDAMNNAMQKDVDYGNIPGTDKPTLLKPGAEKLGVLFQLDIQLANAQQWGPGDHLTVTSRATVFHAPTGARLGYGEGVCSTREKKYAKRRADRVCPECGKPSIIKGKADYGGGWLCWKKKDGCNAKFGDDDQRITGQVTGEIDNPDLADLWNTVTKMAEKRARVDAVLAVTGASALFTQDAEDLPGAPPQATPRVEDKPLTDDGRQKILKAIDDAGLDPAAVLGAANFFVIGDVKTVADATRVRQALDAAKKRKAA